MAPTLAERKGRTSASQRTSTESPGTTSVATSDGARSLKKPGPEPTSTTERGAAPPTRRGAAPASRHRSCGEEEAPRRQRGHAQEQPPVGEAADVRRPVRALTVSHGDLHDAQVEVGGSEDQVEVAVRIEIAEVSPPGREMGVVQAPDDLGAAERILDGLADQDAQQEAEEAVAE